MRRFIVAAVLAAALIVPTAASAIDPSPPGSPQAAALASPDQPYVAAGECVQFTPNSARAWWSAWFAAPYDLSAIEPCKLPGSLVLTADQYVAAVAINNAFARTRAAAAAVIPAPPVERWAKSLAILRAKIAALSFDPVLNAWRIAYYQSKIAYYLAR